MKIWNVYDDEIRELVEEVGLRVHGDYGGRGIRRIGNAYQFRLRLGVRDEDGVRRFQRLDFRGRKIHGVCWHGHREFFFALYRRFPEARVKTGVISYRNRRHFLETYRETMGLTCNGWQGVHREAGCVCQRDTSAPDPAFSWFEIVQAHPATSAFSYSTTGSLVITAMDVPATYNTSD